MYNALGDTLQFKKDKSAKSSDSNSSLGGVSEEVTNGDRDSNQTANDSKDYLDSPNKKEDIVTSDDKSLTLQQNIAGNRSTC